MDLQKSYDVFKPEQVSKVHIIGCGSVGSTIAENIARLGVKKINLYDFDTVERKNITNQMFREKDIGRLKVDALKDIILEINPEADIKTFSGGYKGEKLSGYVFLCVDNIDVRREICKDNKYNIDIEAMFDIRTRLYEAQHFAANWKDINNIKSFLNSMDFTHDEAQEETPEERSACGTRLSVAPTIRVICGLAVSNFMNFVNKKELKTLILADPFGYKLDSF